MRPLILILEACLLLVGIAVAQSSSDSANAPQLPVGQVFKQFEFPYYQDGKLKYTLFATEAKGITLNRAETTDLLIKVYDNGAVSTTVTSPKADLLVNEQRMRTRNTVQIDRDDMKATAQSGDFDVKTKKFVLRNNVKVVLKKFDLALGPSGAAKTTTPAPVPETPAAPAPTPTSAVHGTDSLLTSPGNYSDTNSAPIAPISPSK